MTQEQRRLAALMFADIVGYSAMAEQDERRALRLLDEHRRALRPVLEQYSGREVKSMADGFLAQFDSAVQAAACHHGSRARTATPQTAIARIAISHNTPITRMPSSSTSTESPRTAVLYGRS